MTCEFYSEKNYTARENSVIKELSVQDLLEKTAEKKIGKNLSADNAWINLGGWQSWSPCFEIPPKTRQPAPDDCAVKSLWPLLVFPETKAKCSKNIVLAQFVTYLRWENSYLVLASMSKGQPPVQYIIDRKKNSISIELCDKGKEWKANEKQAQIEVFFAESFFDAKDNLKKLYSFGQFEDLKFLHPDSDQKKMILGWESWYNHYTKIGEKLINEDLVSLVSTKNVLNFLSGKTLEAKNTPVVFQIDDGWETQVGDWTIHETKFAGGLKVLADKIEDAGYIPGLWIAPLLIYDNCPVAVEHPDWLLHDEKGKTVTAGINPNWQGLKTLCTFDLSNDDVIDYLDSIMERAINEWGFRYLKLDFMYAGMLYGCFKQGGAAYQWYDRAIEVLTKLKTTKEGKPVAYLGCGIPMEQSYRCFSLSRIGCDTCEKWENRLLKALGWNGRNEALMNLKDTIGRAMWDKTIYENDPDVIFVRNENCTLTRNEKILIALTNCILSSQIMYSDDPASSNSDEEIALAREISELCKKYEGIEFSVQPAGDKAKEKYEFSSRDGKIKGTIDLGKTKKIEFFS